MWQFVKHRAAGTLFRKPDGITVLLAGIGILAAGLTLARQVNAGMALPWDTVAYISVARSLLEGAGFTRFDGHPLVAFPPFYPILLAGASFGVLDPYAVAAPLNAVIFGLTVFGGGYYLKRRLLAETGAGETGGAPRGTAALLAAGGALALALSLPMARIASEGLSEPLFMLLALLALIQADRLLREGKGSALLWAALFAALACLTRYIGVALLGVITLVLIAQPQIGLMRKAGRIVVLLAIAAAPVALWMLRNFTRWETATGHRDFPVRPLPELLEQSLGVLTGWAFPAPPWGFFEYSFPWLIGGLLLAAAAAVAYDCYRVWRGKPAWIVSGSFAVFGGFALGHFALLVYSATTGNADGIHPRYLTPIYFALTLAGMLALGRLLSYAGERRRGANPGRWTLWLPLPGFVAGRRTPAVSRLTMMAAAGLALWLGWSAALNVQAIAVRNGESREWFGLYSNARWTDSPTMRYIRERAPAGVILSNDAAATYTHIAEPGRHRYVECTKKALEQQVHHESLGQEVYVLWFRDIGNPRCLDQGLDYDFGEVRAIRELESVAELADGVALKAEAWSDLPAVAEYARDLPAGDTIFSNIPGVLREYGPEADYRDVGTDFSAAQHFWLDDNAGDYVVWYNNPYAEPITVAALESVLELEPAAELEDGIVARVDYGFRQDSEIYRYIRQNIAGKLGGKQVLSNAPDTFAPHFPRTGFAKLPTDVVELAWWLYGSLDLDGARIVYWYGGPGADPAEVAALLRMPGIEPIAEWADGVALAVDHEFLTGSATLGYARELPAGADVSSNAAFAMAEYPDAERYRWLPRDLSSFRWAALEMPDGAYVAWLDALSAPLHTYDADKLRQAPLLRVVADPEDGLILQLDDRLGDGVRYDLHYDRERNALVYVREECPPANPQHVFYLRLREADGSGVPDQAGYLKFGLDEYGGRADGGCVATVPLDEVTEYAVSSIRTGQYLKKHWPIWRQEVALADLPPPP